MIAKHTFLGLFSVPCHWRFPGCVRDLLNDDGSLYLKRVYLTAHRYLHHIAQADQDRHMHNHPWISARSRILTGGYLEERQAWFETFTLWRGPGDVVELDSTTYHRIALVKPGTWTLFTHGPRCASWGFDVDGTHVDWKTYDP